jgi:hypothetical protein
MRPAGGQASPGTWFGGGQSHALSG